jgi:glycosyltransferase involved in cell wall biosynthesis
MDQLSATLSKSDVFLVPMGKGYSLNTSLPTKILESQAIGRPIICCSSGAIGNYVEMTKSGICVDEGNLDGFIDAILKLESDEQLCQELGQNGRNSIEKNHRFEVIGKRLSSIIQKSL